MQMLKLGAGVMLVILIAATASWGGYVHDDFTATNGTLVSTFDQWSATETVVVSNNTAILPALSAATNTVGEFPSSAWTDVLVKPTLGLKPRTTNTATTALLYFNLEGYITVYNNGDWNVCSNNIWGGTVAALTGSTTNRISIYQDYDHYTFAVFLDSVPLIQDVPFPKGTGATPYSRFIAHNVNNTATLDEVWIQTTADAGHAYNGNAEINSTWDVDEMQAQGYVARTLYVNGDGLEYPTFNTITAAVAVARTGDSIDIGGTYATIDEVVMLATGTNYVFTGNAFTTATFTVNSGALVTFNNDLEVGTFTANAAVTLANGANLNATTKLDLNGSATLTASATGSAISSADIDLDPGTSIIVADSGTLSATAGDLEFEGGFTINGSDWNESGITARSPLPVDEDFDSHGYVDGQPINTYGLYGWGASSTRAKVQSSEARSGKALILPGGAIASNVVSTTEQAIWTTCTLKPVLGENPIASNTTNKSFMSYVDTNGFMVVWESNAWATCSNTLGTTPHTPATLSTGGWIKVAIYQDFEADEFALFIDNAGSLEIVKEEVAFPGGDQSSYNAFTIYSHNYSAYIDDIVISTETPTGGVDLDGDTIPDTEEIAMKGNTRGPFGSIFKFM